MLLLTSILRISPQSAVYTKINELCSLYYRHQAKLASNFYNIRPAKQEKIKSTKIHIHIQQAKQSKPTLSPHPSIPRKKSYPNEILKKTNLPVCI
ncbi:hypothetical protein VTL71DRAFT_8281 [Oculimacula yallundae]|uniref:Uncharacterized protein n=1 Tax=Oculimacula yallundae TaxID=86028 RepID=A0ABR4CXE5_9HELO